MSKIIQWFTIIAEGAIVVLLLSFVGYLAFGLLSAPKPEESKAAHILTVLNTNWKALLILTLVPLYRPIHRFIAELESLRTPWGSAKRRQAAKPMEPQQTIPSTVQPSSPQEREDS